MWQVPPTVSITYDNGKASSGSLLFTNETHTLGNAARQTILENPKVNFCGYTVPHPAEMKMALRIQADDGEQIIEIAKEGFENVKQWSQNTLDAFSKAWDAFQ